MVQHWPVPLQELTVLAHSMGGLLIRSALYYARQDGLTWPRHLKNIVFSVRRTTARRWSGPATGGHDPGSTPFTAPFARLEQAAQRRYY
ncbi:hypothetical protein [Candidatus Skiveiella danica]|uniref:hypothetical protein n=1 Tax=Candidatus Skiveiella danica TaxID=3386177 RepID=UPI0039B920C9